MIVLLAALAFGFGLRAKSDVTAAALAGTAAVPPPPAAAAGCLIEGDCCPAGPPLPFPSLLPPPPLLLPLLLPDPATPSSC